MILPFVRSPLPAAALLLALATVPSHAQTLQGRTVDRETQQPLAGAEVTLVDARGEAAATTRSGADGSFSVAAAAGGEYRLAARLEGYGVMLSNALQLAQGQTLQVEARLTPRPAEAQASAAPLPAERGITGRVAEAGTGRGIAGANVSLLDHLGRSIERVVSDGEGNFHFFIPTPGRMRLRAERLGYQGSTSDAITVVPSDSVRVELLMSTDAVVLAPLTVTASSRSVARNSRMAAFEWRRDHHPAGRFVGPEQIARIRPFYATDVLQNVPFVQISGNGVQRTPTLRGRFGSRCVPTIYVDGHRSPPGIGVDELVSGPDVAAVEVYDRPFAAPAEFSPNPNSSQINCGVVVIWTRPPGQNPG